MVESPAVRPSPPRTRAWRGRPRPPAPAAWPPPACRPATRCGRPGPFPPPARARVSAAWPPRVARGSWGRVWVWMGRGKGKGKRETNVIMFAERMGQTTACRPATRCGCPGPSPPPARARVSAAWPPTPGPPCRGPPPLQPPGHPESQGAGAIPLLRSRPAFRISFSKKPTLVTGPSWPSQNSSGSRQMLVVVQNNPTPGPFPPPARARQGQQGMCHRGTWVTKPPSAPLALGGPLDLLQRLRQGAAGRQGREAGVRVLGG